MEGWIKLHRKVLDNDILRDHVAWVIFCWLLLKVDRRTGKTTLGRFWASKELRMKPTTFYQALKRLKNKYKMIDLMTKKMTIKYTEVEIINWFKYQSNDIDNDNPMTIQRQSNDNPMTHIQEVENKELRREKDTHLSYLINLPLEDITSFTKRYTCTDRQAIAKASQLYDYCRSKGRIYKDYKAFLRNALSKDFGERIPTIQFSPNLPKISEEERMRNLERIKGIKEQLQKHFKVL